MATNRSVEPYLYVRGELASEVDMRLVERIRASLICLECDNNNPFSFTFAETLRLTSVSL